MGFIDNNFGNFIRFEHIDGTRMSLPLVLGYWFVLVAAVFFMLPVETRAKLGLVVVAEKAQAMKYAAAFGLAAVMLNLKYQQRS